MLLRGAGVAAFLLSNVRKARVHPAGFSLFILVGLP